jgi:hypothetical protein
MPSVLVLNVVRFKVEEPNEKERRDEKRKSSTGRADKRKELYRKSQKRKIGRPKVSLHVRFIRAILNPSSIENAVDNKIEVILYQRLQLANRM